MATFERGDIARVPFPYTDRATRQFRPALVVSDGVLPGGVVWLLMITSAENPRRDGDVPFGRDFKASGLPAPSVVRTTKIATIDETDATPMGRAPAGVMHAVSEALAINLGGR